MLREQTHDDHQHAGAGGKGRRLQGRRGPRQLLCLAARHEREFGAELLYLHHDVQSLSTADSVASNSNAASCVTDSVLTGSVCLRLCTHSLTDSCSPGYIYPYQPTVFFDRSLTGDHVDNRSICSGVLTWCQDLHRPQPTEQPTTASMATHGTARTPALAGLCLPGARGASPVGRHSS